MANNSKITAYQVRSARLELFAQMNLDSWTKLVLALTIVFVTVGVARAENFVFETDAAKLMIGSNGTVISLIEKQSGKEQLRTPAKPLAAVRKNRQLISASEIKQNGTFLHVLFGTSGISADYHIVPSRDSIIVQLVDIQGDEVEELRLIQLDTLPANVGPLLGARWNDDFTVSVMGLSEHVDVKVTDSLTYASVYPEFAMKGQQIAIIAVPTSKFLDVVRKVEHGYGLPSPMIDGIWAKQSADVRTSYLFIDLDETNVDEIIRYAKMGGFRYLLIYSDTWSASLGSYPINSKRFPHGEAGLMSVINKCHAAGLKVGMHMLTSLVSKGDPLIKSKGSIQLLKDWSATLAADMTVNGSEVVANAMPSGRLLQGGSYHLVVDKEMIDCGNFKGVKFSQCERGLEGTEPSIHKSGTQVRHLIERNGAYLADLRSPLASVISDRIAGLIDRVGFDMIYFDGGELNNVNGASEYWLGAQQSQIWERSKRDLLVQGSGITPWTWHIFTRGTSDDYVVVAVKQYLDRHKIADAWHGYSDNFMPAELGWMGLLQATPDHPATTPDELEYFAVRMLALDSAGSLETTLGALRANGRTEEMLKLFGKYEQLRLGGKVPKNIREELRQGEWHLTDQGQFHPITYSTRQMAIPGEVMVNNSFVDQSLKFRLQMEHKLAALGDPENVVLVGGQSPIQISVPDTRTAIPGVLIQHIVLDNARQTLGAASSIRAKDRSFNKGLDLVRHRALAIRLEVDGPTQISTEHPVLNIQLQTADKNYRDYYIDLDFRGLKTIVLPQAGTERMLVDFRPDPSMYSFKSAMSNFDYGNVSSINLRWMRYIKNSGVHCEINLIEALKERDSSVDNIEISAGLTKFAVLGAMETGDYAEYWGKRTIQIFNKNGVQLRTVIANFTPMLKAGGNRLLVTGGQGTVKLTTITLGK